MGGYSDIRLWPCYALFSASILFAHLYLRFFLSFIAVSLPSLVIAVRAGNKLRNNRTLQLAAQLRRAEAYRLLAEREAVRLQRQARPTRQKTTEPILPKNNFKLIPSAT